MLEAVSYEKDVDGFHPINVGTLCMQGRTPLFVPCTPKGCIELLVRSGVQMKGKSAAVIGRSNIVGTPAAHLLQVHLPHVYFQLPHQRCLQNPHLFARDLIFQSKLLVAS